MFVEEGKGFHEIAARFEISDPRVFQIIKHCEKVLGVEIVNLRKLVPKEKAW